MDGRTRWGRPQRGVDGDEKKVQEAKLITGTWAGPHQHNSLVVISTDTILVTDARILFAATKNTELVNFPSYMSLLLITQQAESIIYQRM